MSLISVKLGTIVIGLMMFSLCFGVTANNKECTTETTSDYSQFDQLPNEAHLNNDSSSITGQLPIIIQEALDNASSTLLTRSPAVSIAVAIPNAGVWYTHKGIANAETNDKVNLKDGFRIASITKAYTSVILMQLVQEDKIKLSDKVSMFYPKQVVNGDLITVEHLLMHTSGLSHNVHQNKDETAKKHSIELEISAAVSIFCPGSAWSYSNIGYTLLGKIIENVENKSLSEVIAKRITKPLHLTNTYLQVLGAPLTVINGHQGGALLNKPTTYANAYAAGGMTSTALELVKFWHALLTGKLVDQDSLQIMYKYLAPMDDGKQMFYGKGVQFYNITQGPGQMLGHSGSIAGFRSVVAYIPESNVYIAVLFNDQAVSAEAGLWHILKTLKPFLNEI